MGSVFEAGVVAQALDALVQLVLRQIDFLIRAFLVEQAVPNRRRDLVQIANLGEDLVRVLAQLEIATLVAERAPVAKQQLVLGELARLRQDVLTAGARDRTAVRKPRILPILFGEPEAADVLDAVEPDAASHLEAATRRLDGSDERLGVGIVRHAWVGCGAHAGFVRKERIAANSSEGCSTYGTCPAPSMTTRGACKVRAITDEDSRGIGSSRPWTTSAGKVTESSPPGAERS